MTSTSLRCLIAAVAVVVVAGRAHAGNQPPGPPTLSVPYAGTVIDRLRPSFVIEDAVDPDGDRPSYQLELATDETFADLEHQASGAPRPGARHTIIDLPFELAEDSRHCWRARADDGQTTGEDRVACFRVSTHDDPPSAPVPATPVDGELSGRQVQFSWSPSIDPEGARPTYLLELEVPGDATIVTTANEAYQVVLERADVEVTYLWRVRAVDPAGLTSAPSSWRTFTLSARWRPDTSGRGCDAGGGAGAGALVLVGLGLAAMRRRGRALAAGAMLAFAGASPRVAAAGNQAPPAPRIVSPRDGAIVPSARPVLLIDAAVDPDGDPLTYDWQLAADPDFGDLEQHGERVAPSGDVLAGFDLAGAFAEQSRHCWRVRADDGVAAGPYSMACFRVSVVDDPPAVPVARAPGDGDGTVATTTPIFSWTGSADPEDEQVTYEVEVLDPWGSVVAAVSGVVGTVTVLAPELGNRRTYSWRVRAVDSSGAKSDFSLPLTFEVNAPVDDPVVCVNSGGDGWCDGPAGCNAGHAPGSGSLAALVVALAVAFAPRRPRRQRPGERSRGTR